jgi:hypothetical protein
VGDKAEGSLLLAGVDMSYKFRLLTMVPVGLLASVTMLGASTVATAQNDVQRSSNAQNGIVPPELVHVEKQSTNNESRYVTVGNDKDHYWLFCKTTSEGCIQLQPGKNYYLFNSRTRWKLPRAKEFMTLSFIQYWTSKYKGESIGLVPEDRNGGMGMFVLDTFGAGHQLDTAFVDGPIRYGTGMTGNDLQSAWKYFSEMFIAAVAKEHGTDALGAMLGKRCFPDKDYCVIALDAKFTGIGGSQEPRMVILLIFVDPNDIKTQFRRAVCIRFNDRQVCRDWNTGKLMLDEQQP